MGTGEQVVKNTGLMLASNLFQKILKLVLVALIARMLGVSDFGLYSFVFSYVILFGILANPGLDTLNLRDIAQDKKNVKSILATALSLKIVLSLLTLGLVIASITLLGYDNATIFFVFLAGVSVLLDSVSDTFKTVFFSFERVDIVLKLSTVSKIVLLAGSLAALFSGFGVVGLVVAAIFASIVNFLLSVYYCATKIVKPEIRIDSGMWDAWAKMLVKARHFFFLGIFMIVFGKIDIIMLSYFKGNTAVGYYGAAVRLIESLAILSTSFYTTVFPVMSRYFAEQKSVSGLLGKSSKFIIVFSLPTAVGTTIISSQIISVIYGIEFVPAAAALSILIWYTVLNYLSEVFNLQLYSMNRERTVSYIFAFSVSLNIILNFALIPQYSFIGSAVATFVSQLVFIAVAGFILRKELKKLNWLDLLGKPLLASAVMAVAVIFSPEKSIWFVIPLGAIVYFACLFFLRGFSQDEISLIKKAVSRK